MELVLIYEFYFVFIVLNDAKVSRLCGKRKVATHSIKEIGAYLN